MQEDLSPLPVKSETQGEAPVREPRRESREEPPEKSGGQPAATAAPGEAPAAPAPPPQAAKQAGAPRTIEPRGSEERGQRPGPRGDKRAGGAKDQRRGGRPPYQSWSKPDFLARAVEGGIDRQFIENAFEFARSMGSNLSPEHVRGVQGEVLRQEMAGFDTERFLLLKPRLAYLAARAGRPEMRDLKVVLERGVDKVCADGIAGKERQERFERFSRCLEAILAYHKVYERRQGERV